MQAIREFASERLQESTDAEHVRQQHGTYFLALAERAEHELKQSKQAAWMKRLDIELGNIRAALHWAYASGAVDLGLRLAGALTLFWGQRGHLHEGQRWLEELAVLADTQEDTAVKASVRAQALLKLGVLLLWQGDFVSSTVKLQESLHLFEELDDQLGIAEALTYLGCCAFDLEGNTQALAIRKRALAMYEELNDARGTAVVCLDLANAALYQGDLEQAALMCERASTLFAVHGDQLLHCMALAYTSRQALARGDLERAGKITREALTLAMTLGHHGVAANRIKNLADIAWRQGHMERAALLYAVAAASHKKQGTPEWWPDVIPDYEHALARVRTVLGEPSFSAAWESGYAMSLEQAIQLIVESTSAAHLKAYSHVPIG